MAELSWRRHKLIIEMIEKQQGKSIKLQVSRAIVTILGVSLQYATRPLSCMSGITHYSYYHCKTH